MIYKIGNMSDLDKLPLTDDATRALLHHHASVLTTEYGKNRNIDTESYG